MSLLQCGPTRTDASLPSLLPAKERHLLSCSLSRNTFWKGKSAVLSWPTKTYRSNTPKIMGFTSYLLTPSTLLRPQISGSLSVTTTSSSLTKQTRSAETMPSASKIMQAVLLLLDYLSVSWERKPTWWVPLMASTTLNSCEHVWEWGIMSITRARWRSAKACRWNLSSILNTNWKTITQSTLQSLKSSLQRARKPHSCCLSKAETITSGISSKQQRKLPVCTIQTALIRIRPSHWVIPLQTLATASSGWTWNLVGVSTLSYQRTHTWSSRWTMSCASACLTSTKSWAVAADLKAMELALSTLSTRMCKAGIFLTRS